MYGVVAAPHTSYRWRHRTAIELRPHVMRSSVNTIGIVAVAALKQKLQLLRCEIAAEPANAGDVSARLVEDRIGAGRGFSFEADRLS